MQSNLVNIFRMSSLQLSAGTYKATAATAVMSHFGTVLTHFRWDW